MNEKISWDPSLIKKFSSSNHFKLLNQLRNEVKKYPLNNKKKLSSNIVKDNKFESINNLVTSTNQDIKILKNLNSNKEINNQKSYVSFNNSKNFSIYNNSNTDSNKDQQESTFTSSKKINEDNSPTTFNDRLNKIDMK